MADTLHLWLIEQRKKVPEGSATAKAILLFAGSLRAGKRAAAVMSLVHSARLNGRSVHVLEGHPRAAAHATGQPRRRTIAPSLAPFDRDHLISQGSARSGRTHARAATAFCRHGPVR